MLLRVRQIIDLILTSRWAEIGSSVLVVPCMLAAIAGYLDFRYIFLFVWISSILLVFLIVLLLQKIWRLWKARRDQQAGSRLHIQIVTVFSCLVITPIALMAFLFVIFVYLGINTWFSTVVKTAIQESQHVVQAYLLEHSQTIQNSMRQMLNDFHKNRQEWEEDKEYLCQYLTAQANLGALNEAVIINSRGSVIARSDLTFSLEIEPLNPHLLSQAQHKIVIFPNTQQERVMGLVSLYPENDWYLWVSRLVDRTVRERIASTQEAVQAYEFLLAEQALLAFQFGLLFFLLTLLLLFLAIWGGLHTADYLIQPIVHLMNAALKIKQGDLTIRIPLSSRVAELETLGLEFNKMVEELAEQRQKIFKANDQLEKRRQFIENVLAGVSSGVIGLDKKSHMHLKNKAALMLLNLEKPLSQQALRQAAPELEKVFLQAQKSQETVWSQDVIRTTPTGSKQILRVVLRGNWSDPDPESQLVMTFDDITELLIAQRQAAWSEVARRIAHEIKNPLTPIQLSAERLKRKYTAQLEDKQTFQNCIETIVRQVGTIEKMVGEFVSFARLPLPVMENQSLEDLCKQAIALQEPVYPYINFQLTVTEKSVTFWADAQQINRVLINLLKNAAEAIEERLKHHPQESGKIEIRLIKESQKIRLEIQDNGTGFPKKGRDRLCEPYVTTKIKGTGLGLAIAKKIIEDHGGDLLLLNNDEGFGGCVVMRFPAVFPRAGYLT